MQVYSHHPCEKPLWKGFLLNRAKDLFTYVAQEQLRLGALPNITNALYPSNP